MADELTPVFVKIDNYKEVLDLLDVIKDKLEQARGTLTDINKLKDEEDRELGAWTTNIDDIEKKIAEIDKTVFGKR
ncbi:hypothetical protein GF367_00780 [Candidatus Woesearchaeota archaeon]|nr:hypothetical protein [Candidatus Woesearchaeota archaeon]